MSVSRRTCLLFILATIAIPLYAVDGVVLINQNAALAGNVTPGDAPGFPITITVPGSYRLSGNLTVPDADTTAIHIEADHVTIDLNGFSIIGPTRCGGIPVQCAQTGKGVGIESLQSRLLVINGSIEGMGSTGISFVASSGRVERVHAFNNGSTGIFVENGAVVGCNADSNGGDGISVLSGRVIDSTAVQNGGNGIAYRLTAVITNNQATGNDLGGIASLGQGGQGSVFSGNSVAFNRAIGIQAVCPSLVTGNAATGNVGGDVFTIGSGCIRSNNVPAP